MAVVKTITDKMDFSKDFDNIAKSVVQGDKILIPYQDDKNLVLITEQEYDDLKEIRKIAKDRARAADAFRKMRAKVVESGDFMTDEEINDEIRAARENA